MCSLDRSVQASALPNTWSGTQKNKHFLCKDVEWQQSGRDKGEMKVRGVKVAWKRAAEKSGRMWAQFPTEHCSCPATAGEIGWLSTSSPHVSSKSTKHRKQTKKILKKRFALAQNQSPNHPQDIPHPLDALQWGQTSWRRVYGYVQ